jgi:methylated-DNA-[protein]-cysteine S-methyltransferase
MTTLELANVRTPIGEWTVLARDGRVVALSLSQELPRMLRRLERRFGPVATRRAADPAGAITALRRYFAGDVRAFDRVPVDAGGTEFQRRVWRALRAIRVGTSTSYAALAQRIGAPAAIRAVGHANAVNPVALIVPCHRVVASDGTLRGYAHGLDRKRWLLDHEAGRAGSPRARRRTAVAV